MKQELMQDAKEPPEDKFHLCPALQKDDIKWVACKSDGFVLTSKHLYETNLFGRLIWEMCDGKHTIPEIYNEVEKTLLDYFAPDITEQLMKDIKKEIGKFLYAMEKEKLIVWKNK